jgi:uncharacterized protein YgbK (DUF1537 family)
MILLGCIADDLTGASDLAANLAREGLSVIQVNGVPDKDFRIPVTDAVVVALKSRTIPAADAIAQSLGALAWLRSVGATRIYFKYCSTFDSTAAGNIGPVTEALQDELGSELVPATPAYPRNHRTVYRGHLFVGDQLLNETGMRNHPLTPMTDPNLVRLLAAQTKHPVGLIGSDVIDAGVAAIRQRVAELVDSGVRHAIVDAVRDEHLTTAGAAFADASLTSGGAGLGVGLARALRQGHVHSEGGWTRPTGKIPVAWLSGSCSDATRRQLARAQAILPGTRIDPLVLAADATAITRIVEAARAQLDSGCALVYATAEPAEVAAAQKSLGGALAATLVEDAFRTVASALAEAGAQAFVVAGGETSGAVVDALGVTALAIGPEIDPGVPWTHAVGGRPLWLALKSGNFGADDFFARATAVL